ncbi:nuclear transport factor 2 family protein [Amycolatopsis sp. K13G38]|uniref:Nuclear transport factor 2 family protein n=2 Tax=Amycolatopsis acididurans TaxID=2724524 RepID=A0ABX1J3D6_9PSEU|nr:nuclear transport factor 2 family protein [Amycolatopsis acididurans]
MDVTETVARLLAIEEIERLKARYFRFVDEKRWDEFGELFTEDVVIDIEGSAQRPRDRAQLVAATRRHYGDALTVHHGHMPEIEIIDSDHARGVWAMVDMIEVPEGGELPSFVGYGHYRDEYRRDGGGWRISRLSLSRIKLDRGPLTWSAT